MKRRKKKSPISQTFGKSKTHGVGDQLLEKYGLLRAAANN